MPIAMAPKAPCVDVWLSPHAIVSPGCVRPSCGTDDVDDPLLVGVWRVEADPEVAAVAFERDRHFLGHHVEKRALL